MIYPTRRAILVLAAGAPVALVIGLIAPGFWLTGAGWMALILGLTLMDAVLGPRRSEVEIELRTPRAAGVGLTIHGEVFAHFTRSAPGRAEVAIETNTRLTALPERFALFPSDGGMRFDLKAARRGEGEVSRVWMRWQGPLGLVWKQVVDPIERKIAVTPNIAAVRDEAMRLFSRDAMFGQKIQFDTGEGAEFHALREIFGGMDTRTIDWKQSAKHMKLLGKEYRTERNNPVIFAIDTGRLMCEPVLGEPRVDRAINASLILAFISLKLGDRVGFFGFDERPRMFTGALSGAGAFPLLQRMAANLDYSPEETNFTLGLTELGTALERRSLVIVFTDFADTTSAEMMIENVARLLRRHVVLFVVMRDEELESIARATPDTPEDVSRAVTADVLLRERDIVTARLRRLGAHIVDAPVTALGSALINAYLDLKRRELV